MIFFRSLTPSKPRVTRLSFACAPQPSNTDVGDETVYHPGNSGGVLFSPPHFPNGPTKLKFMVQLYPTTTPNFIEHHGREGTARYLRAAAVGIELQKALAKKLFGARIGSVMDEQGSVLVAEEVRVFCWH